MAPGAHQEPVCSLLATCSDCRHGPLGLRSSTGTLLFLFSFLSRQPVGRLGFYHSVVRLKVRIY